MMFGVLEPVLLFNRMLMDLRERYRRLKCPIERYCPFYDDWCLGKYMYCPLYIVCRDSGSVARCIHEHLLRGYGMTWRDMPSLINSFLKTAGVSP